MVKVYPFKREVVGEIFRNLLKKLDYLLPEPKVSVKKDISGDSNYCSYHHRLGHTIEYCISFKNRLKRCCETGAIILPRDHLVEQHVNPIAIIFGEKTSPIVDGQGRGISLSPTYKKAYQMPFQRLI